jgi:hypothetical protein
MCALHGDGRGGPITCQLRALGPSNLADDVIQDLVLGRFSLQPATGGLASRCQRVVHALLVCTAAAHAAQLQRR